MDIEMTSRSKGSDLKGMPFHGMDLKTIKNTYVADRSAKRMVQNMKWIVEFIRDTTPNLNTRSTRVYQMKKYFMTLYPKNKHVLISKHMVLSTSEYKEKAEASSANREVALEQVFTITPEYIAKLLSKLKANNSLEYKVLLLQLSTGRRVADVLYAADIPIKKGHSIVFTRLSKSASIDERKVPLYFISYATMMDLWIEVREELRGVKNLIYAREKVMKVSRRLTGFGSHFFRKLYVAHSLQFKPKRWSNVIWINRVLAHKQGDLNSALNYSNITMGVETVLTKSPKEKKKSAAYERLLETVKQMNEDKLALTHVNIKAQGYGSSTIGRHLKDVLAELGL